ncbi:Ubiquitin carboxyl-terminal hydrolase 21 [Phytophthora citrophthora]|uniref:ubiquitinyl hydrolase 1 n=1 Tax=Phytophthora citrophthora TaxID=4793 RepID=A0AAD9G5D1_9STRA|nr:Ubiquitin carboxyl-terminal hydrolase 21 [Phytophthora citrophthora]
MVEKRRSPVGDSPPATQRRKKLNTQSDTDAEPMDVEDARSPAIGGVNGPQQPPDAATVANLDTELPMLIFHDKFPVLDLSNERVVTDVKKDAQNVSWRLIWQPRSVSDENFIGVFVELVEQQLEAPRLAELTIVILNQGSQPPLIKHTSVHEFSKENAEFGMSQFVQRSELLNPSNTLLDDQGRVEVEVQLSFVDAIPAVEKQEEAQHSTISANQDATDSQLETTQQLISYDSKEETGMVGLKNQGATCYLNSLLQTLFHLRAFRQVVYETPTAQEDTNNSVSLALQRVFYRLQRQQKAVSTKELTRSFGWSAIDSFMQHDVQELYRILCDRLEEKMKKTRVDSAIQKLFEGKVLSFVQCVNVDFESSRDESFYDLQLDVKGCRDLMQSFRKYVEVEMLDGDNQYEAEGHGKQDAKKGIKFLTLPPVLNIQLKRFEYDAMRDGMVKIHDRFEFPKTLVLDEFMSKDEKENDSSKKSPRYIYHLHSVLVHSGDVHGGHYYVFIRPGKHIATSTDWFRFDDDQITHVDEQVAIEGNFGSAGTPVTPQDGTTEPPSPLYSTSLFGNNGEANGMDGLEFRSVDTEGIPSVDGEQVTQEYDNGSVSLNSTSSNLMLPLGKSFSSAYMLVYVRDGENDISAIQGESTAEVPPATSEDITKAAEELGVVPTWQCDPLPIPEELMTRFHEEEKAAARRKKAQQTEHLYMNLRIASDTSVAKLKRITKTLDFSGFNNSSIVRVRIKRAASIRQLCRRIYRETGVPMAQQRLWKVITRENRTTRPDQPVGPDQYDCRVDSLIEDDASHKAPVKLYLQILDAYDRKRSIVHRHFLDEFTPPEIDAIAEDPKSSQEMGEEDEDAAAAFAGASESEVDYPPPLKNHDILLFIKLYDLKKELGDRLEYVGNIVVDARITGAELAKHLHEALEIPLAVDLKLYEEVQPVTVSEIDVEATLAGAEIQNGDIICFQYVQDEELANGIVLNPELGVEDDPDAIETTYIGPDGEEVKAVISPEIDDLGDSSAYNSGGPHSHGSAGAGQISVGKLHRHKRRPAERYPDVRSYFQYLLDRVEVTFHRFGHSDEETFTLPLLLSNVYDEVIDAVAAHLDLIGSKRLFVRLYQHSPFNNLPMKTPLRHSRYAGDNQTTLEELLTEYLERTNILHYELLDHPITEIEAKKELLVHLSIYDACFATEQATSPSHRHVEVLVLPTHKVRDLLKLIRDGFGLPEDTPLRACEVVQRGTVIQRLVKDDASLSRYWENGGSDPNSPELLVEQIPSYELVDDVKEVKNTIEADDELSDEDPLWFYKGVVHFNFQNDSQKWIHPHGVPCIVRFSERDTVGDVKERIRQR